MLMTNITNEQLEAWASLGPWHRETGCDDDGEVDLESQLYVCDQDTVCDITVVCTLPECHITDSDKREERVRLIAAAPALAAALLAERKAREVEVGELKFEVGMKDKAIRLALKRLEELTNQTGTFALFASDIALIRQALKGPTP
jgi:hypothetical protein